MDYKVDLYFFHSNPCEACHEVNNLYDIADETHAYRHSVLNVVEYVQFSSKYKAEVEKVMQWFELHEEPKTPFLVIGNTILEGYEAIREGLIEGIEQAIDNPYVFSEANLETYGTQKMCLNKNNKSRMVIWIPAAGAIMTITAILIIRIMCKKCFPKKKGY